MATRDCARVGHPTSAKGVTQSKTVSAKHGETQQVERINSIDSDTSSALSARSAIMFVSDLLGQAMSIMQLLDQTQGDDVISGLLRLVGQDCDDVDEMESSGEQLTRLDFSETSVSVSVTQSMLRLVNTPERDCSPLSGVDTILQVVIDRLEAQQSCMRAD